MPELPEVTNTVNGLNETVLNLKIRDVWTDYFLRTKNRRLDTIKNKKYFKSLKKEIIGEKIKRAERRGKNILIHLTGNKTLLIHMKMTGHLLYGTYTLSGDKWKSDEKLLSDPFNQFIHFIVNFSNGQSLAFSDMRKFAKILLLQTEHIATHPDIVILGPEANDSKLDWKTLKNQLLKKPEGKIKTVLMDQGVVAGIGNIYSDEILWASGIHPERKTKKLSDQEIRTILWQAMEILSHSIVLGGDSMSDYRNIYGKRGGYQDSHKAYRRTKMKCLKKGCSGVIVRKVIAGRSAHFCSKHQK